MLPLVNNEGRMNIPLRMRLLRRRSSIRRSGCVFTAASLKIAHTGGLTHASQDAGPAGNLVAHFDGDLDVGIEHYVHPRAELDKSYALAATYLITDGLGEHDTPGEQAGDLLEHDSVAFAFHGDDVLFV